MAATDDPFSVVYGALMSAFTEFAPLTALIRPGNIRRFDADAPFPVKPEIQASDLPELSLLQSDHDEKLWAFNSRGVELTQRYTVILVAMDLRVVPINLIKFNLLRAVFSYDPTGVLRLPRLVRRADPVGGRDAALDGAMQQYTRGVMRWTSVITFRVEMAMSKGDFLSGNFPTV